MGADVIRLNNINNAISGRYILAGNTDGALPKYEIVSIPVNDHHNADRVIDWGGKELFMQKMHAACDRMLSSLAADPGAQNLLNKPKWSLHDRYKWEEKLFNHALRNIRQEPLFDKYRFDQNPLLLMNSITEQSNFSCAEKSITGLVLAQTAEYKFLQERDGFKSAGNYYLIIGRKFADDVLTLRHAFIISEPTVNLFDPTNKWIGSPADRNVDFARFITGERTSFAIPKDEKTKYVSYSTGIASSPNERSIQPGFEDAFNNPFWTKPREVLGPPVAPSFNFKSTDLFPTKEFGLN